MSASQQVTTIDVSVHDMLTFGDEFEEFVDLVRERACDALELESYEWLVTSYNAISIASENVIRFNVEMEHDA